MYIWSKTTPPLVYLVSWDSIRSNKDMVERHQSRRNSKNHLAMKTLKIQPLGELRPNKMVQVYVTKHREIGFEYLWWYCIYKDGTKMYYKDSIKLLAARII